MARCYYNEGIKDIAQVMIEILKTSDSLCRMFIETYLDDPIQAEIIMEVLIEGKDKIA